MSATAFASSTASAHAAPAQPTGGRPGPRSRRPSCPRCLCPNPPCLFFLYPPTTPNREALGLRTIPAGEGRQDSCAAPARAPGRASLLLSRVDSPSRRRKPLSEGPGAEGVNCETKAFCRPAEQGGLGPQGQLREALAALRPPASESARSPTPCRRTLSPAEQSATPHASPLRSTSRHRRIEMRMRPRLFLRQSCALCSGLSLLEGATDAKCILRSTPEAPKCKLLWISSPQLTILLPVTRSTGA